MLIQKSSVVQSRRRSWWDREFTDATNDPNDPYDKGAPDYQGGEKKDLKFRAIVNGVRKLIRHKGWDVTLEHEVEEAVVLWIDWQSIYQDDKEMKGKGVRSLIHWATQCEAMLIPTEHERNTMDARFPHELDGYGTRGWVRTRERTRLEPRAPALTRRPKAPPPAPWARARGRASLSGRAATSPIARAAAVPRGVLCLRAVVGHECRGGGPGAL